MARQGAPKVLVFDSGVGGLSVLAELRQRLPQCQLLFACDNEAFPYGTKDEATLVARVEKVLMALVERVAPDIVVLACNSASTLALPRVRSRLSIPVVGVVPAIKPAAVLSRNKCIGLLATPGTVRRTYTQQLIDDFASDCRVIRVGSNELVSLAEQKLRGETIPTTLLEEVLAPMLAEPALDTVVLACTHFPLLRDELDRAAGRPISWVDSGEAIARRVASLLPAEPMASAGVPGLALVTALDDSSESLAVGLAQYGCEAMEVLSV